jgi:hypothetical protein
MSILGILLSFPELLQPDQLILAHGLAFGEYSLVLSIVGKVENVGKFCMFFLVGLQKSLEFLIIVGGSLDLLSER